MSETKLRHVSEQGLERARSAKPAPQKFTDPNWTAKGARRASVTLTQLETLWINTGTLCNLACPGCYIESSPRNDRLVYISREECRAFLEEISQHKLGTRIIGFTGGEPFMNPATIGMLTDCLDAGLETLVLTNAMRPMMRLTEPLLELKARAGHRLHLRVSLDHYGQAVHEEERGPQSWVPAMEGIDWLFANGFSVSIAGRQLTGESLPALRTGYGTLFETRGWPLNAHNPEHLVLFPEMDSARDVPEISEECWDILGVHPDAMMCASSRMVVKHKGADRPTVAACTLLPYDPQFDLGPTLSGAIRPVQLNHPYCAQFCVLGGASCSGG